MRITAGEGVHVVYDGDGADTFYDSLASLRYHGVLAYYGQTIECLPRVDLLDLPKSVLVTYRSVIHHVRTHRALLARTSQLFDWVRNGQLKIHIGHRHPLADTAKAHTELEARNDHREAVASALMAGDADSARPKTSAIIQKNARVTNHE